MSLKMVHEANCFTQCFVSFPHGFLSALNKLQCNIKSTIITLGWERLEYLTKLGHNTQTRQWGLSSGRIVEERAQKNLGEIN